MIIAIDGTTASGKGTLARKVAERYGLKRLDTGAIYRGVALALLDAGADPSDVAAAAAAAHALDLEAIDEDRIRSGPVGTAASIVSAIPAVRDALLDAQRRFAAAPQGTVLDGRDIGTVVCPRADVKLFVTADLRVRAERRWKELHARGESVTLAQVEAEIAARDRRDSERLIAPLRPAPDAHLLDTTSLSIEAAAAVACHIIDAVIDP
ncbi:MAG: (d)CMP kinase [Hyphomonadaceae bacterium]|nr:MAG: cytidylate kinase [Caulobacteraceae bacterium]MBT9446628.1 (d)CMP kinase [Hyphomonadaceae bacterium]